MKPKSLFSTWQWLTIMATIISMGAAVTAFAFNVLDGKLSKAEFAQYIDGFGRRLDRIEAKIDKVLEK